MIGRELPNGKLTSVYGEGAGAGFVAQMGRSWLVGSVGAGCPFALAFVADFEAGGKRNSSHASRPCRRRYRKGQLFGSRVGPKSGAGGSLAHRFALQLKLGAGGLIIAVRSAQKRWGGP